MRVRRLAAGELAGDERARTEAHVAGCARCQGVLRELEGERARLQAELPFERFAAGVAERLAAPAARPLRPRAVGRVSAMGGFLRAGIRRRGLALAAGLLLAAAVPAVLHVARDGSPLRLKGGAELSLYVREEAGARVLSPGEPIPRGAALRVGLSPAGRRFAAVALLDAEGAVVLHAGRAEAGVLPGAFEWTGPAEGTLVAVLADAPVDAAALADRLARGGPAAASPGGGAEVLVRPLRRAAP
jgi:hypothetical protein